MKQKQCWISALIVISSILVMIMGCPLRVDAVVRETTVTTPSDGMKLVGVPGRFQAADIQAILALVNSYRKEACENGYPNPERSSSPLTPADYSEVKWSGSLEWIAQTRSAEGTVYQSHTRPNGKICFTVSHDGITSSSENLAWNGGNLLRGIRQWYGEKEDWVKQASGAETGHYTAMITPSLKYIGIGCFTSKSGDWSCIAGAFSTRSGLSEEPQGVYGECTQLMEVKESSVSELVLSGADTVMYGDTNSFIFDQTPCFQGSNTALT